MRLMCGEEVRQSVMGFPGDVVEGGDTCESVHACTVKQSIHRRSINMMPPHEGHGSLAR
jgi:hypothetical protein